MSSNYIPRKFDIEIYNSVDVYFQQIVIFENSASGSLEL